MVRKIVKIDQDLCNGCGLCAEACHEGAIGMVDGKAKLLRDDYCDGLGDCLPVCPTGAISFEEREAAEYDEAAVQANMATNMTANMAAGKMAKQAQANGAVFAGCPGKMARAIERAPQATEAAQGVPGASVESQLGQWPVQLKLVPVKAPYFDGAKLLIAADCTAFAYGGFHERFMKGRITLIGCPKLDAGDYSEKLTEILRQNDIKSVTVARMEVPCCAGLANAAIEALKNCGKMIPWQVVTISTEGKILDE